MKWDEYAESWDERPATRAYAQAAFDSLLAIIDESGPPLECARVLDFGCGTGLLTEKFAPVCHEIVALDPSVAMTQVLAQKVEARPFPNVHIVASTLAAATETNRVGAPFDLVVCSSVCAFLDDYQGTVQALVALLKPKGRFVQYDWELDPSEDEPFGLSREQVRNALLEAGLDGVVVETAFEVSAGDKVMKPLLGHGRKPSF